MTRLYELDLYRAIRATQYGINNKLSSFLLYWRCILHVLVLSSYLIVSLVLGSMKCKLYKDYQWELFLLEILPDVLPNAARTELAQRPERLNLHDIVGVALIFSH